MRRPILTLLLASLASAAMVGTALAAAITVDQNEVRHLQLSGLAANVVVGDPKVADVAMLNGHNIVITGIDYGQTAVLITDKNGHILLDDQVYVSPPEQGRMTVYHGVDTVQYACGGHCQVLPKETTTANGSDPTSSSTTTWTTSRSGNGSSTTTFTRR